MRCSSSSLCILESENVGIPSALSVSSLTKETLRRTTGTAFLSSFCPFFIDKSPTLFALVSLPSFEGAFHPTRRNSSSSLSICARVPLSNTSSAYFLPTDPGCLLFTEASVDEVIGWRNWSRLSEYRFFRNSSLESFLAAVFSKFAFLSFTPTLAESSLPSSGGEGSSRSNPSVRRSQFEARLLGPVASCLLSSNAFKTRCSKINLCAANAVLLVSDWFSCNFCLSILSFWRSSAFLRSSSRCFFFSSSFSSFTRIISSASLRSTSFLILSRSAFCASRLFFSCSCICRKSSFSSSRFRRFSSSSAFRCVSPISVPFSAACLASSWSTGGDSIICVFVCWTTASISVCFFVEVVFPSTPLDSGWYSFVFATSSRNTSTSLLPPSICFFKWILRAISASLRSSSSLSFCRSMSNWTKLLRFSAFRVVVTFPFSLALRTTGCGWGWDCSCGWRCVCNNSWEGLFSRGRFLTSLWTMSSPALKSMTLPRLDEILSPCVSLPSITSFLSSNIGFCTRSLLWKAKGCSSFLACFDFCFSTSSLSFSLIFSFSIRINSSRTLCCSSSSSIILPASVLDRGAFFGSCFSCANAVCFSSLCLSSSNFAFLCSAIFLFSSFCLSSSSRAFLRISLSISLCLALSSSFLFFSSIT